MLSRKTSLRQPHVSPRQAAVGVVVCIAVLAAAGLVHPGASPGSSAAPPSSVNRVGPTVAPSGGGDELGSQDRAAAEAVASEFVSAALGAAADPPATQRHAVRPYDTDRLDAALAPSALSDDLTTIQRPARVDGVVLLVASMNGVDARVDVTSLVASSATHVVSVTLRRDSSGWKVDDLVSAS